MVYGPGLFGISNFASSNGAFTVISLNFMILVNGGRKVTIVNGTITPSTAR